ncbi:cyclic pyranopterin monophosphate synthase MoaC [uncultured Clostridium sp.]|uniref:cyclic pyranopterin monophosphate synthase MoaC n=1 Tax=uncultured Clostridium sp. TaxID=59620 RepID=UPI002636BC7B|nr:cyclic pyranopterin monophosphate synthase MoaC [uncultured Clostridium sp.]
MDNGLTHFDKDGNAVMVDVSEKKDTNRVAVAVGKVLVSPETLELIKKGEIGKGDVLGVARVAGIMGMKRTSDLIPMCHPIMIKGCYINFKINHEESAIEIEGMAKLTDKTGVEMEALTGVSIAALTIYDMCKAVDKRITITDIHLKSKKGGKSGDFFY